MLLFRKLAISALAFLLGASLVIAQETAPPKEKGETKKGKKEKAAKGDAKQGDAKEDDTMDLPVPKGQPQKGVKIPVYGANGKLKMNFEIGIGTYIDEERVKLQKLRVETFHDDGTLDLDMDLPDAIYNKKTKILSSDTRAVIKRSDFEITGNNVSFNVETRQGTLGGGVKMIITNVEKTASGQQDKPAIEFHPAEPAKPADKPVDKNAPK